MAATLFDLVRVTTPTTGVATTLALGPAVPGFLTFAGAGVPDGTTVSIAISDTGGAPAQGLTGRAVYSASASTLTIATILASTNSGAMIPLSGSAQIAISPSTKDLGSMAAENIGPGLADDGAGNVSPIGRIVRVSTSQTPGAANHLTRYVATGPIAFNLPKANAIFAGNSNGYGFSVEVVSGVVTFTPNAADAISPGAVGASLAVSAPATVFISCDGASSGTWFADVIYPGSGNAVQKTTSYTVQPSDNGFTHYLDPVSPFTATVGSPAGFPAVFKLRWYNFGPRGVLLNVSGITPFYLYPGQSVNLENDGGVWTLSPKAQRFIAPGLQVVFDPINGSNSNDGLAFGAGNAFQDLHFAWTFMISQVDFAGQNGNILMASGSYTMSNIILSSQPLGHHIIGLIGDTTGANPQNYQIIAGSNLTALFVQDWAGLANVTGIEFSGSASNFISTHQHCVTDLSSCLFGSNVGGIDLNVQDGAKINLVAPVPSTGIQNTISGNCAVFGSCNPGGNIEFGAASYPVSLPLAISTAFLVVSGSGATISLDPGVSFSGLGAGAGTSGYRTLAAINGAICLNGITPSNIPGAAGNSPSTGSGGQIV
jgi:hypothetical protein